ncbi:hypothetical protein [Rasiella sp. SM2506]|uniref:hypothetical protein n=1 Tax=Rasiella sp. SM2506 TaxID=3423914 RepID=UPI003D79A1E5
MKVTFTTALVLCIGFICLSQSKSILATTSFNGFHCDGKQGICDIDSNNRSAANTTLVLQPDNKLIFTMDRQNLSQATQEKITGINPLNINKSTTYYFKVPQIFTLPQALKNSLSESGNQLSISKGSYPILITENTFTIIFNLE